MATRQPKKPMEIDPVCEAIMRDKDRPLSAREMRERDEAAKKKAKTAKKK